MKIITIGLDLAKTRLENPPDHRQLPAAARGKRPSHRRAPESRDELAPFRSIGSQCPIRKSVASCLMAAEPHDSPRAFFA